MKKKIFLIVTIIGISLMCMACGNNNDNETAKNDTVTATDTVDDVNDPDVTDDTVTEENNDGIVNDAAKDVADTADDIVDDVTDNTVDQDGTTTNNTVTDSNATVNP